MRTVAAVVTDPVGAWAKLHGRHADGGWERRLHDLLGVPFPCEANVRFGIDRAWATLRPGGAIVIDDIDANRAFRTFTQTFSGHQSMICEAEPLRPDPRRFNNKGLFGIILKEPTKATH
jgi:hypothetical protein